MVTQTIYATEADLKAQVSAGKATAPTDVCVQKVVRVATVIVLPLHQLIDALEPTDFATQKQQVKTAELFVTTEARAVPFTKLNHMAALATWQADSAV